MKINIKNLIICVLEIKSFLFAITWPVANTDPNHPQPQVAMTYGDWHGGGPAEPFHRAIDIPSRGGTSVFAVRSGTIVYREHTITGWICCFREDNTGIEWWYFHLKNLPIIQHYNEGEKINEIYHKPDGWGAPGWDDHLHLIYGERDNPADNPLLQFPAGSIYRDPPDGTIWPCVWTRDLIENRAAVKNINGKLWWLYPFWANKPIPKIYDYVDILVKAQDFMGGTLANGSEVNTGVYKLGFYISTKDKRSVLGEKGSPIIMHEFTGPLPSADKFDAFFSKESPSSNWHDFYYIVTNIEGDATRCWATKARSGSSGLSENDPRARIHSEALYPDGDYIIWLMNWDAAGNIWGYGEATYVSVDNFRPYVRFVQIGQEEKVVKYQAHWPEVPQSDYDLGQLIVEKDDYFKVGKALTFVIEFSEEMQITTLPTLQVQMPNGWVKVFNPCFDTENNLGNIYS